MGRKRLGVGGITVTVPMDIVNEVQEYMDKHNISRSRVTTLALEKFLNSKTKPSTTMRDDYLAQQKDHRKEIKGLEKQLSKLEKQLSKSEKELESSSSIMEAYVNKAEKLLTS